MNKNLKRIMVGALLMIAFVVVSKNSYANNFVYYPVVAQPVIVYYPTIVYYQYYQPVYVMVPVTTIEQPRRFFRIFHY